METTGEFTYYKSSPTIENNDIVANNNKGGYSGGISVYHGVLPPLLQILLVIMKHYTLALEFIYKIAMLSLPQT